jgi:hypothetical protein
MLNIAVIDRDPPIIMAITIVVMTLAFLWEIVHRRHKARMRAATVKPPPAPRLPPGTGPVATST